MNPLIINAYIVVISNSHGEMSAIGDTDGNPFPTDEAASDFAEHYIKAMPFYLTYQVLPIIASSLDV